MKLFAYLIALGGLLVASAVSAVPSTTDENTAHQIAARKQRGFQVFRNFLLLAYDRAITWPRKDFSVVIGGPFARDDFPQSRPFELLYLGTLRVEGVSPKDSYEIHLSSEHLWRSPDEYIEYTAAQIACRLVKQLNQGGAEEEKLAHKCACEAVGRNQCVVVHVYIAQKQGNALEVPRTLDEAAAYLQAMENEVKERYGIIEFEWP
jgi:hypothetical protein